MSLIQSLKHILPARQICDDKDTLSTFSRDWGGNAFPSPELVVFPHSTGQVRDIVLWANETSTVLIPSGGRTGLSSGVATLSGKEVVVSFQRMNRILELSEIEQSLTVEAGVITKQVQNHALEKELFFPLSFASEGSSHIGGNVATNAGGVHVIKYGNIKRWTLGLEVVTGRGDILNLGRGLVKNSAGYDLMNLFIGSEGTLGLICKVTLALTPKPAPSRVFLFSVPSLDNLTKIFCLFKESMTPIAFEMFMDTSLQEVLKHKSAPFLLQNRKPYYILLEVEESQDETALKLFEKGLEKEWIADGVRSENDNQKAELWSFRENISESLSPYHPHKNDVSVRVAHFTDFITRLDQLMKDKYSHLRWTCFGHMGDGNVHINILRTKEEDQDQFLKECDHFNQSLFSLIQDYGGSISAEHGVGLLKKNYLSYSLSQQEIHIMKGIKNIFDPKGILNPGKIFD